MTTLLHLDSSAHRDPASRTRHLTARFAGRWLAAHPGGRRVYRDLAADPVPALGTAYCALGRRVERLGGGPEELIRDDAQRREWELTRPLVDELVAAQTLVVGAPTYNDGVPAALKAWIDRVTFPGALVHPDGASRLAGLRVVVVTTCGGARGPERDFLTPYLRAYFRRHGVPDDRIDIVTADRTLAGLVPAYRHLAPLATASLERARERVSALASS